jgi:Ca2+-dependent lipid-binding protein
MRVQGVELANKDGMFGKSDPYLKFWAIRKDGQLVEVHRTETISSNLNPVWKPFAVDLDKLCNGDLNAKFKLQCWDEDALSTHDEIGWIETTVAQLLTKQPLVLQ